VLVLGLAHKRNTGDCREAPGVAIVRALLELGAQVRVADPLVDPTDAEVALVDLDEAELSQADLVVLVTDHDAFDYELVGRCARRVLDTRNRMTGPVVERL
jgi:UDP-N-acetyl-D-mannosaminuronate dehydrogenase